MDYVKKIKPKISLSVYQKNTKAVSFYKREHFVVLAESIDKNTDEKELLMLWHK